MRTIINKISLFVIISLVFTSSSFSQTSGYKVTGKIIIGGESRWDYTAVDASLHRLYVSHATKVHVIDLSTNKVIGKIDGLNGVHGIAFAPEFGKGFISNGRNDSVTIFNLKTLETIGNVHVTGQNPDAIVYEPFTKRIFTFNGRSSNATAIDAKTDKVVGTVSLDGKPEFSASNEKGIMYVNIEDKSLIEEFNPRTLKVISKWPIVPCENPSGLAIDLKNNRLFAGGDNKLMAVVDAKFGKVITAVPIGGRVDACAFDPETNLVFSSNGEGTLTVVKEVSANEFKVLDNVPTEKGLRTMALDPATHNIYLIGMIEDKNNSKSFGVLVLEYIAK